MCVHQSSIETRAREGVVWAASQEGASSDVVFLFKPFGAGHPNHGGGEKIVRFAVGVGSR